MSKWDRWIGLRWFLLLGSNLRRSNVEMSRGPNPWSNPTPPSIPVPAFPLDARRTPLAQSKPTHDVRCNHYWGRACGLSSRNGSLTRSPPTPHHLHSQITQECCGRRNAHFPHAWRNSPIGISQVGETTTRQLWIRNTRGWESRIAWEGEYRLWGQACGRFRI